MLKKRKNVNKIKIIIVALMVIVMTLGVYIKLKDKGTNVIEIESIATDSLGHMKNEQLVLEAQKIDDNLYEIELPKSINSKTVNQITNVVLESKANEVQESINIDVVDNKIQLTKEQMENYNINLGIQYDIVIKQQQEDESIKTIEVEGKTAEEIQQLVQNDNTEILYNKTLKHEEVEKESSVELKGKLPETAELQVEQLSDERIKEIFGDTKISIAYDIKIINNGTTKINPEDFGEICEVSIKDANIETGSTVYHVKDDNTLEKANILENTDGNISFEAQSFSVYGIGEDEIIPEEGEELGVTSYIRFQVKVGSGDWSSSLGGTDYYTHTVTLPVDGSGVKVKGAYNYNGSGMCIQGDNVSSSGNCNMGGYHLGYGTQYSITKAGSYQLSHYGSRRDESQ